MAESIVQAALVGVGEDGVRFRRLFEFFFGGTIARIAIRVVLHRQLTIGTLDVRVVGRAADAENLVIIPLAHAFATLTNAGLRSLSFII